MQQNSKLHYPTKIHVDTIKNSEGKMEKVWISTGPYRKEVCGDTRQSIGMYLANLKFKYFADKYKKEKIQARKSK